MNVLATADTPGRIVELDYEWHEPFAWADYSVDIQAMLEEEGAPIQDWKPKE